MVIKALALLVFFKIEKPVVRDPEAAPAGGPG